ncbi:MAG: DUF488 family protein [Ginsengibacter sp.]
MPARDIIIKSVYEKAEKKDGYRIMVDRLWPRGISKEKVNVDRWLKEIAPSTELRKWFDHDPGKWASFQRKYETEIKNNNEAVEFVKEQLEKGRICFVYSAKDEKHNDAVVLEKIFSR